VVTLCFLQVLLVLCSQDTLEPHYFSGGSSQLDIKRTREELWYQYQAEVATLESFGQRNAISFDEWLVIKGYCKNETRAGI